MMGSGVRRGAVSAVALALVGLLAVPSSAELDGTSVELVAPVMPITPGEAYVFVFEVSRDDNSDEYLKQIDITFPFGLVPVTHTLGYDEIEDGRPEFNSWPYLQKASWWEEHPESGGIHSGETTRVWATVQTLDIIPDEAIGSIEWSVRGNWGGEAEGECQVATPVDASSWGAIKALFRR